jgi:hypothetical protein
MWEVLLHENETRRDWVCSFLAICIGQAHMVVPATLMDTPPLLSVQQQQAEQMRVYWKVHSIVFLC